MNRLGKILTLGLSKKRAWQLRVSNITFTVTGRSIVFEHRAKKVRKTGNVLGVSVV